LDFLRNRQVYLIKQGFVKTDLAVLIFYVSAPALSIIGRDRKFLIVCAIRTIKESGSRTPGLGLPLHVDIFEKSANLPKRAAICPSNVSLFLRIPI